MRLIERGVALLYARMLTDLAPACAIVFESVFDSMDEAHLIMFRGKGLPDMAASVRRGWRTGVFGYQLESHIRPVPFATVSPSPNRRRYRTPMRPRSADT